MQRPGFMQAWASFMRVDVPVAQVGRIVGGKVADNIASGTFENACPIRMSYVLNNVGVPVPAASYHVVSGADRKWYMYRVGEMMTFLARTFGKPDIEAKTPRERDFVGRRGIILIKGSGWSNAQGHVTLWNGSRCSDRCHLTADPDNGTFVPSDAALLVLP